MKKQQQLIDLEMPLSAMKQEQKPKQQHKSPGAYLVCWTTKLSNGGFSDDYRPFSDYKKAAAFYAQIINYTATWTAHMTRTLKSTDYDTSA